MVQMSRPIYRNAPVATSRLPTGIPFIIANEGAERFSFYGMRAILVVFMTQYLLGPDGTPDTMGQAEAKGWFHLFVSAVYFTGLSVCRRVLGPVRSDWIGLGVTGAEHGSISLWSGGATCADSGGQPAIGDVIDPAVFLCGLSRH